MSVGSGARLQLAYGVGGAVLLGGYPLLATESARAAVALVACAASVLGVAIGWRRVERTRRLPWTLLLCALGILVVSNLAVLLPNEHAVAAGWLGGAVGNGLVLAAALAMIVRRSGSDLGGVIDSAVIAFAAGSLLWALVPHRLGDDTGPAAQLDLFVAVFALTGVLGALQRMASAAGESRRALRWLMVAIGLAVSANVVTSAGGGADPYDDLANLLFVGAFTATGLFGLDPSGPRLTDRAARARPEQLSNGRLVFLGAAVAAVPAVVGARALLDGRPGGLLVTAQGALVATLVMVRIGLLAAQRTRAEEALSFQATHDLLTGLPNRRQFVDRLQDALGQRVRCVLLFCDLDGFKDVNDRYGHEAGDRLLTAVADRLADCVSPADVVSRFGGDEFAILLVGGSPGRAQAVRAGVSTALARPYEQIAGATIGVSIGLATAQAGQEPEDLLRVADRAMYADKTARRRHA